MLKARFPETKHMLRQVKLAGHLADGAKRFGGFLGGLETQRSGPLPLILVVTTAVVAVAVDLALQHVRGPEHQDTPGRDRHLVARLRVAAYALRLLAHLEGTEGRQLHAFAPSQRGAQLLEYVFDHLRGLVAR